MRVAVTRAQLFLDRATIARPGFAGGGAFPLTGRSNLTSTSAPHRLCG